MNRKQVIETLEMENDLICFNPLTGEEIPLEYVNDLNRKCYDAHQEAIRLINNSIPIEWMINKLIEADNMGIGIEDWSVKDCYALVLDEWMKENEKQKMG